MRVERNAVRTLGGPQPVPPDQTGSSLGYLVYACPVYDAGGNLLPPASRVCETSSMPTVLCAQVPPHTHSQPREGDASPTQNSRRLGLATNSDKRPTRISHGLG